MKQIRKVLNVTRYELSPKLNTDYGIDSAQPIKAGYQNM